MNKLYEEADKLKDEANFFDDLATWAALDKEGDSRIDSLRGQIRDLKRRAKELVNCILLLCEHVFHNVNYLVCRINEQQQKK